MKSGSVRLLSAYHFTIEAPRIAAYHAYPNYFGDVQLFKTQLNKLTKGKDIEEYTVKPQETVAPRPRENPDLSWIKRRNKIRWE
jgi:hypothetical protein